MGVAIGSAGSPARAAGRLQTIVVMGVAILAIAGLTWYVTNGFDDGVTNIDIRG